MRPKRILVTGAGSGFGRGAALALAAKGHAVIAAVQWPEQIAQLNDEAKARGTALRVEKLDLLSEADRRAAFAWDIDVLVNNAAVGEAGPIAEIPLELVRKVFEVNVFATLALTQGFVKQMVNRGRGRVIFVSSSAGLFSAAYFGAYCASKHALEAMSESLHAELAAFGIQVATVNPGPYGTGFNERMIENTKRWFDPKQNFTRPQDLEAVKHRFEKQFDPEELIRALVEVVESESGPYRNVLPRSLQGLVHTGQQAAWDRQQTPPGVGAAPTN